MNFNQRVQYGVGRNLNYRIREAIYYALHKLRMELKLLIFEKLF